MADVSRSKSKHSKSTTFFCPCDLGYCKGKKEKIYKKTIKEHFLKCGRSMVSNEVLRKFFPAERSNSSSDDDDMMYDKESEHLVPTSQAYNLNTTFMTNTEINTHVHEEDSQNQDDLEDFSVEINPIIPDQKVMEKTSVPSYLTSSSSSSSDESDEFFDESSLSSDKPKMETWDPVFNPKIYKERIAEEKLFVGSNKSVLTTIGERFGTFTSSNMSKGTMSHLLALEKDTLPQPNLLPKNYYEARKLIEPYLIPVRKYDVCPKHCIVYRNSSEEQMYEDLTVCPVCGTSRYSQRGRVRRQVKYIPVGPRLARIYGNESLAAMLHGELCDNVHLEQLTDIQDSPEYRKLFMKDGVFSGDKNGIVVGLEADGVAPFHSFNQTYSFTIVTVPIFSLLRKFRMLFRNIFIVMIIPGDSKAEAASQDAYFEILVDELLYLTKYSKVQDYSGAPVKLKIKLLLYILDYPGFCKLFHLCGSGAIQGCIWCHISGVRCKHLNKTVYLRNRSYLPSGHILRDRDGFPISNESKERPRLRTQAECDSYALSVSQAANKAQAMSISGATGIKGQYSLRKLPGHDRLHESNPDGMHTIQRCLLNIHSLLVGKTNLTKVREQEKEFNRFQEIWPTNDQLTNENPDDHESQLNVQPKKKRKQSKQVGVASSSSTAISTSRSENIIKHPPYVIKDIELCNRRFLGVKFPFGSGIKKTRIFSETSALNSHDWKELACRGILKFCVRGQLAERQEQTLYQFLDLVARMFSEAHMVVDLDILEVEMNESLALMERDFPVEIQNITQHLLHHVVDGIRRFGPLYSTWMFGFERLNGWCSQRAINKRHPESTIIETYRLYDFSQTLAAMGIIKPIFLEGGDNCEMDHDDRRRTKGIKLTKAVQNDIHAFYRKALPELEALWQVYHSERKQRKTAIAFADWEPFGRNLSPSEKMLMQPLEEHAKSVNMYYLKNQESGRVTVFSTGKMATEDGDSSVVCISQETNNPNDVEVGKIVQLFEHNYLMKKYVFCTVEIIPVEKHKQTGLMKCRRGELHGLTQTTVEINNVSLPLVTAEDEDGVWILR